MTQSHVEESVADIVNLLFMEIFDKATVGHHRIGTANDEYYDYMRFAVGDGENNVFHEPNDLTPLEMISTISSTVLNNGYAPVILVSMLPTGISEVRGWVIELDIMRALTVDEIVKIYGVDHSTGKFKKMNPNLRYFEGWNEPELEEPEESEE